jgi:N,N'-diacetyllegionaminate synthase
MQAIKDDASVFVIAEAGVNHNGKIDMALALCDAAHASGADAVKFQTFRARDLVVPGAPTADYQQQQTGQTDQYRMLEQLELTLEMHQRIAAHCKNIGIEFFSTPFSVPAVDMLVGLDVQRLKLSSGELTHKALVMHAAATQLPLLLSTGMANMAEIREALGWIELARGHLRDVVCLHCTSAYPAPDETLHLRAITVMQSELGVPVGYSDHSTGIEAALAAVALGAVVIEKHITLDRQLPGPDHSASLEPAEFGLMVKGIRRVQAMRGRAEKAPQAGERDTAKVARRSVVAAQNIEAGAVITEQMLECRRPATGIEPRDLDRLIGARAKVALAAGTVLQWSQLEGVAGT